MTFDNKETLSQLMDGEWQDLDAAQSVKAACADDELKSTWSRYHLIRDVIRNDEISIEPSLTARISQAIEDEPTYSNVSTISPRSTNTDMQGNDAVVSSIGQTNQKSSYWKAGLGGVALAASVALATVVGLNVWQVGPDSGANTQSVASTSPAVTVPGVVLPEVEYVSNKGTYWTNPEAKRSAAAEKRLNAMLSTHIEQSPTAERTGILPYSRLVGYDSISPEQ